MRLVALVLSWNGREDTLACLESLRGIETICVDNASSDGSAEAVAERFPEVELIRNEENLGFAGGNNVGLRQALERGADWVLLLNNDAVADPGLAQALEAAAAARPDAGVLACKVFFADPPDVLWYAGMRLRPGIGWHRHDGYSRRDDGRFDTMRDVESATGAAMAVSRTALERVGLLDEELFAYVEDVEWCLRIRRAGFGVVFVPGARVWHKVSAAMGGAGSPTGLYYDTRNTLAVLERHRPLPPGLRALRRLVVVGSHLAQAARQPGRRVATGAVVAGWRDYRAGRMGPR